MNTKQKIFIASGLAILLSTVGVFLWIGTRPPQPVTLTFSPAEVPSRELTSLRQVLSRFTSLYPHISVIIPVNQEDPSDVTTFRKSTSGAESPYLDLPSPWTGELWLLAANKSALRVLEQKLPGTEKLLRDGNSRPQDFQAALAALKSAGITPLTLGNSHSWPFMLWLQHWTAALSGPEAAARVPQGDDPSVNAAFEALRDWKEKGYFYSESWSKGWAAGLGPLTEGLAAFALVSSAYMGPLEGSNLEKVELLPFPGQTTGGWSVGSAVFLGVSKDTTHPEEARLLVRFLTSPGITQELTRLTDRPYFSWDASSGKLPLVLPSWADAAMTPEYEAVKAKFKI